MMSTFYSVYQKPPHTHSGFKSHIFSFCLEVKKFSQSLYRRYCIKSQLFKLSYYRIISLGKKSICSSLNGVFFSFLVPVLISAVLTVFCSLLSNIPAISFARMITDFFTPARAQLQRRSSHPAPPRMIFSEKRYVVSLFLNSYTIIFLTLFILSSSSVSS